MWYILIIDGTYGREYHDCDTLSEAQEKAEYFYKFYLEHYGTRSYTQILKVVKEY